MVLRHQSLRTSQLTDSVFAWKELKASWELGGKVDSVAFLSLFMSLPEDLLRETDNLAETQAACSLFMTMSPSWYPKLSRTVGPQRAQSSAQSRSLCWGLWKSTPGRDRQWEDSWRDRLHANSSPWRARQVSPAFTVSWCTEGAVASL